MARLRWGLTAVALALGFGFSAASAETPALFAGTGPAEGSYADALPVTIAVSSYVPPACAAKPCPLLIAVHPWVATRQARAMPGKPLPTGPGSSFWPRASTRSSFPAAGSSKVTSVVLSLLHI